MEALSVLIIDDEKNIRHTLRVCLEAMGAKVAEAAGAQAAVEATERCRYDVAFLDLRLGNDSGLDVIPRLLAESPNLTIVVVTAYGTIETAVQAMRRGAWDYLPKPFTPAQIRQTIERIQKLVGSASCGSAEPTQRRDTGHLARFRRTVGARSPGHGGPRRCGGCGGPVPR